MSEQNSNEGFNQDHAEMSDDSGGPSVVLSSRKRDRSAYEEANDDNQDVASERSATNDDQEDAFEGSAKGDDQDEASEESATSDDQEEASEESANDDEEVQAQEESEEDESVHLCELGLHKSYPGRLLYQGVPGGQQAIERLEQQILEAKQAHLESKVEQYNLASKVRKAKKQLQAAIKESGPNEEFLVRRHVEEFHNYCSKMLRDSNTRFLSPTLELHWTPATFDLSEAMDEWYKKFSSSNFGVKDAFPYLFASEAYDDCYLVSFSKSSIHAAIASKWHTKVHKEDASLEDYYAKEFEYPCQGTSREFFNRVWDQLGRLEVDGVKLFQHSLAGLVPVGDDFFIGKKGRDWYWQYKEQISCYYRAFGRILAHCVLLKIPISEYVLPRLYMTKLFRGMDPWWHSYDLETLIKDLMGVMNLRTRNKERGKHLLFSRLGLEETDFENELELRKMICHKYFGDRRYFVSNVENGITLGGTLPLVLCFRLVPTNTVAKVLGFCSRKLTEEMIFNSYGEFRFIQYSCGWDAELSEEQIQGCENFWQEFVEWFKEKLETEPSFIVNFFHLVTGMSCIPDAISVLHDFRIDINFDETKTGPDHFLPVVSTCSKTITLPVNVYNGDIDLFELKLRKTMEYVLGDFDITH